MNKCTNTECCLPFTERLNALLPIFDAVLQHLTTYAASAFEIFAVVVILCNYGLSTRPYIIGLPLNLPCDHEYFLNNQPYSNVSYPTVNNGLITYPRVGPGYCMPLYTIPVAIVLAQAVFIKLMVGCGILYMKHFRKTSFFSTLRVLQWFAKLYVLGLSGVLALMSTTEGFESPTIMRRLTNAAEILVLATWLALVAAGEFLCIFVFNKIMRTKRRNVKIFLLIAIFPIVCVTLFWTFLRFLYVTSLILYFSCFCCFVLCVLSSENNSSDECDVRNGASCIGAYLNACRPFSTLFVEYLSPMAMVAFLLGIIGIFGIALVPITYFLYKHLVAPDDLLLLVAHVLTGFNIDQYIQTISFVMSVLEAARSILVVLVRLAISRLYSALLENLRETYTLFRLWAGLVVLEMKLQSVLGYYPEEEQVPEVYYTPNPIADEPTVITHQPPPTTRTTTVYVQRTGPPDIDAAERQAGQNLLEQCRLLRKIVEERLIKLQALSDRLFEVGGGSRVSKNTWSLICPFPPTTHRLCLRSCKRDCGSARGFLSWFLPNGVVSFN